MATTIHHPIDIEDMCRGPLFVGDTALARANKAALELHFAVEWASDIEATMATIHPDDPWQRIPALGVDVRGFAAVRQYYIDRFASWPGRAMQHFDRVTIVDTCVYTEGTLEVAPKGRFGGVDAAGKNIRTPVVIVVDCRDGLILGETVYMDASVMSRERA